MNKLDVNPNLPYQTYLETMVTNAVIFLKTINFQDDAKCKNFINEIADVVTDVCLSIYPEITNFDRISFLNNIIVSLSNSYLTPEITLQVTSQSYFLENARLINLQKAVVTLDERIGYLATINDNAELKFNELLEKTKKKDALVLEFLYDLYNDDTKLSTLIADRPREILKQLKELGNN